MFCLGYDNNFSNEFCCKQSHVIEGTEEAILYTQDVNDALASVKVMNEVGPPVFSKMISTLNASLQLLPTLYQSKT